MSRSVAAGVCVCAGLMTIAMVSCRRAVAVSPMDGLVRRYLTLCVELGERDPDALDFYVGPEAWVAGGRREPAKPPVIAERAAALREEIAKDLDGAAPVIATERDRARAGFLDRQLRALGLRAEMLAGKTLSVEEEGRTFFGVTVPADAGVADREDARAELGVLLGGKDGLAHRYSVFERGYVVPYAKVSVVFGAALRECRAATVKHVTLPAREHVEVQYVTHKPWSGYSYYQGRARSVIEINMDYPLTVDRILDLACHEGYPGHHVFNTMREVALVDGAHEPEWLAQLTFSPQSFVSEAAASYAAEMAFSAEERLRVERDILYPLAGMDGRGAEKSLQVERLVDRLGSAEPGIAREYLDGRLEYVRAGDALEHEALMEQPDALLLYLNEYRSYMLTYTVGREMVGREMEKRGESGSVEERWRRYVGLMTRPVDSLVGFEGGR